MSSHRPLLYVCAPYQTRTEQETVATQVAMIRAVELGWVPVFGPGFFGGMFHDEVSSERKLALELDKALLHECRAMLIVGTRKTDGMREEIHEWEGHRRHLRVFHDLEAMTRPELPWGENVEHVENAKGWVCKACGRFWGSDERLARWCCAKQNPCDRCGALKDKLYTVCDGCRDLSKIFRRDKAPKAPWDGNMIFADADEKEWFHDLDAAEERAVDRIHDREGDAIEAEPTDEQIAAELELMGLWLSEPNDRRCHLEPSEYLADELPDEENGGPPDLSSLDAPAKAFNDALDALPPLSWTQGKVALDVAERWKRYEVGGDLRVRPTFRAGDVVLHGPTGEKWGLAADEDGGHVYPEGWPETCAEAKDCELVEAAGDQKRRETLLSWARKDPSRESTVREEASRRQLQAEGVSWAS